MTGKQKALKNVSARKNRGWKTLSCLLAAAVTAAGLPAFSAAAADFGWEEEDGKRYWYENGIKQGTEGRGKEIYDPSSDAWYWLDAVQGGALTTNKDVYQESLAGEWGDTETTTGERAGKWVRYDENGHMVKGWSTNDNGTYYFDLTYGTMAKGTVTIDGVQYTFDRDSGILKDSPAPVTDGWVTVGGASYWYENGIKQGTEGRGKEIYDPGSDAWYWLDAIQGGAMTRNKDVYQESPAGEWGDTETAGGERTGKWVRYDENGHMVKGWSKNDNGTYYFDLTYGTMAKGTVQIEGSWYTFDAATGILQREGENPTPAPTPRPAPAPDSEKGSLGTVEEGENVKYSGMWKGLDWKVTDRGKLIVTGNLTEKVGEDKEWNEESNEWIEYASWLEAPWKTYDEETRTAYMDFTGATSLGGLFYLGEQENSYRAKESCIEEIDLHNLDTSQVTDMGMMFSGCGRLTNLNITNFDTSKVRDMGDMFEYCASLPSLDLSHFDTSQTWSMNGMFWGCNSLGSLDISSFDTSGVRDMWAMFSGCSNLISLDVSNLDTSQVTDMLAMFSDCSGLRSLNLSNFDTSQVTAMLSMFSGCNSLTSLDLSSFDTRRVVDMSCMFQDCNSLTSLDLSSFDTSQVTDMGYMFRYSDKLANIYVGAGWREAAEKTDMFKDCGTDHVTIKE